MSLTGQQILSRVAISLVEIFVEIVDIFMEKSLTRFLVSPGGALLGGVAML